MDGASVFHTANHPASGAPSLRPRVTRIRTAGGGIEGSAQHRVSILVYDGVKLLDAVPAEVFGEANRPGANYTIVLVSPTGADVTSSIGIRIAVDDAAATEPAPDTFLVAGADLYPRTPVPGDLIEATRTLSLRAGRVASICTGAFILGAAGLLDGKRATIHWKAAHDRACRWRTGSCWSPRTGAPTSDCAN
ncbi:DJ-1/PfpI family protein [Streptomyces sp. SAI-041]|uniref:DJ-1/PfpI family protein n=1 Tax=Streptomyces sp. SAI-041 TaxID=2940548 RepID=UPI002474C144|nr:DJ-1/PfpI family protein [Streptomyces sp. SAI-041]